MVERKIEQHARIAKRYKQAEFIARRLNMASNGTRFRSLSLTKPPVVTASLDVLSSIELREGFRLPPSYCDFAQNFGYGLLCNFFIIYIPKDGGDDLTKRSATLTKGIREGIENNYIEYEPDGTPELVQALIPFGISENGDILAWNPDESSEPDEYFIFIIGYKLGYVKRAAPNLYAFVESCLDKSISKLIGGAVELMRPTFQPYDDLDS
jgi:hypothetical protein